MKVHNKHHGTAPADAVYIGRGDRWGNPFIVGRDGTRDEVCDRYEREILPTLNLTSLVGKDLVCFCKPKRCHGDSIVKAIQDWKGPGEAPHQYSPDIMAMGDCRICGHVRDAHK